MPGLQIRPLLRDALRVDRQGLDLAAGLRVGVCVVVPVAVGVATGHDLDGMVASLGALNTAMAEGLGNYSDRARTLVSVLVGNAVAVGAGVLTAMTGWWGVPVLLGWVLAAAYVGVIGSVAERTGWFSALMFMIGLGLPEPSLAHAGRYAGFVAIGGIWAVVVIMALWPFHPHRPVLRAVGRCLVAVADLLELVARSASTAELDRAVARAESLGHEAVAITRWRWVRPGRRRSAVARLRELATVADHAGTCAIALDGRLRRADLSADDVARTRTAAAAVGRGVAAVGDALLHGRDSRRDPREVRARRIAAEVGARLRHAGVADPALARLTVAVYSLAGEDGGEFEAHDSVGFDDGLVRPDRRRAQSILAANLTVSSFWFRYAARFAIAAAIGLVIARSLGLEKGYWVLITIAVVIKPQLSLSTITSIHRVAGTVLGALFGGLLVIAVPSAWGLIVVLFVLTMVAISLVRVNYGLAVVFITPLVLVLLNVPAPGQWELADTRLINTLLGAAIGVLATTAILPSSARGLVVDRSRLVLRRAAAYLRAIGDEDRHGRLSARRAARTATDDLLAVIDRAMTEPTPLSGPYLSAATHMGAVADELWKRETELALTAAPEDVTPRLRRQTSDAAQQLDHSAEWLVSPRSSASSPPVGDPGAVRSDEPTPDSLVTTLRSVQAAVEDLVRNGRAEQRHQR